MLILIDDMGWPDLSCYGNQFNETPTIDRLCAEGMKFTDFYAATPVCSSTRCTIQSGQYSARVGITDFIPGHCRPFEKLIVPPIENALPRSIKTPGDQLKAAGYATGYFGKWHLGPEPRRGPETCGYDVTAGTLGPAFQAWRGTRPAGPKRIDLLTDQTIWFIREHKDQPFFVTLSHHAVHIPLEASAAAIEKFAAKPKPATGVNNPVYAAMIEDLDRSVGRILTLLDALALDQTDIGPLHIGQWRLAADLHGRGRTRFDQCAAARRKGHPLRGRHPRADDRPLAGRGEASNGLPRADNDGRSAADAL